MSQSAAPPVIAMRGAGYYSENTVGAKAVIDAAGDLVMQALAGMDLAASGPFSVADYGCADGGTSIDLMRRIVAEIRSKAAARPITITYTDLPHNDFSVLFRFLHGHLGKQPGIPLGAQDGVFTFASGTSFYRQILPPGTLALGFSATAMHWLSRLPGGIADAVQAVGATPAERAVFRAQAMADWDTILLARAAELRPGGKLVLANFCEDEVGRYLGATGGINMFGEFARHWRWLRDTGAISDDEYRAATFPQFYKTPEEFAAPFLSASSPVSLAGLRLDHISTRVTGCPYAADFKRHGDARAFAKAYVPTLRSWTESTFAGALDKSRPAADRQDIIDRFYRAYEDAVAAAPEGHAMDYVHCFMAISKSV
jgi:hypothetical protein